MKLTFRDKLVWVLIGFLFISGCGFLVQKGSKDAEEVVRSTLPQTTPINARMIWLSDGIVIFNDDGYDWRNVSVRIGGVSGKYRAKVQRVEAGKFVGLSWREFYDSDGEIFDSEHRRAFVILVYCQDHDGVIFSRE